MNEKLIYENKNEIPTIYNISVIDENFNKFPKNKVFNLKQVINPCSIVFNIGKKAC